MVSLLEQAFGDEFVKSYKVEKNRRVPKLNITGVVKREILNAIKTRIKPESTCIKFLLGQVIYDLVLVETGEQLIRNKFPSNPNFINNTSEYINGFKWLDNRVSVSSNDPLLLDKFQPNTQYVLVGIMKIKPGMNNKVFHNFRVDGIITMDDIVEYNANIDKIEM